MIDHIELNAKILVDEEFEDPDNINTSDSKETFIYFSAEYTEYSFTINVTLNVAFVKYTGKVYSSDIVDDVTHEVSFITSQGIKPFPPGEIWKRIEEFIEFNSVEHEWLQELKVLINGGVK
jgi:hypothetical protein